MHTKVIAITIAGAVIIAGGSFFAGTKYQGESESPRSGNFPTMGQNGQMRTGPNGGSGMRAGQAGGMTIGEILSKDDTSITVKLLDGGSKIVFFGASTTITKSITGSSADLVATENVVVSGSANADGSINAQSIQLGAGMQGLRQGQNN